MSGNKKEEALIHVQGLGKSFGAVDVLKDISVDINKGDVVFVIGPSGSGKSTFLRCLNRLEEPTRGHISLREPISQIQRQTLISIARRWEWYSSSLICSLIWTL